MNPKITALDDPFGTKELIQLVAKKPSSQVLLFALAMVVILVAAGWLFKDAAPPILIAILVAIVAVFIVGTAGYLFGERKKVGGLPFIGLKVSLKPWGSGKMALSPSDRK